jgi:predicted nucleic acid-binding protein
MTHILTAAIPAAPRPGLPLRSQRLPRPRLSADVIAALAARATPRDRWLLRMLAEHRVLTSIQIAQLAYGAPATARHRLLTLWRLRAIDRIQPFTATGSAPMHYVLGDAGAALLAAEQGLTAADAGYRRDLALAIFASPQLAHTVGTNGVMTALAASARTRPGCALAAWWPERRCAQQWGDLARPDAYGRWHEDDRDTDFFLEYDTGTEPVSRVAAKLPGYAALAEATGITTPVLFWFPSPAREDSVRSALAGSTVPVATATPAVGSGPADRVWLPTRRDGTRLRLPDLALPPSARTRGAARPAAAVPQAPRPGPPGAPVPPMPPER